MIEKGRKIYTSNDGSTTLYWPKYDEHYHSVHGAIAESNHVFIENGLKKVIDKQHIQILEMGFGTGLNAILTYLFAEKNNCNITYHTIEAFPLNIGEVEQINFSELLPISQSFLQTIHELEMNKNHQLNDNFSLKKFHTTLQEFEPITSYDIIYYDAFAPSAQPELWTHEVFQRLYDWLKQNGILTTYCAKGQVKRDLKAVGFDVVTLPGPPHKREMINALKQ